MPELSHLVLPEEDGWRVTRIIRDTLQVSSSQFKSARWNGQLLVDGQPAHAKDVVHAGQTVTLVPSEAAPCYHPEPWDIPLTIPYVDDDLLVVDKPAGMTAHASNFLPDTPTVAGALAYQRGADFIFHVVNRLDKGTTGLMAVAKSGYIHDRLRRTLHTDGFYREYRAVCVGCPKPPAGTIDAPISRDETSAVRRMVRSDGQRAVSHYEVLSKRDGLSFVKLRPETGRTHQLRVHMAHIGCPLAGDWLYGTEDPDLIPRPALHAYALALTHPVTGTHLYFTAPIPADMEKLI